MKLNVINLGKVSITVDNNPWTSKKAYDRLVVVYNEEDGISYLSRKAVPVKEIAITQSNREYWIPLGKPSINVNFGSFKIITNINALPSVESDYEGPYLLDGTAYFWVGQGGDTLSAKYQSVAIEGRQGSDGKSAYELWQEENDDNETTLPQWLASLKGAPGDRGVNGKSAYDLYVDECVANDEPYDDKATWLANLKGPTGESAYEIALRLYQQDHPGATFNEDYFISVMCKGQRGERGAAFTYSDFTQEQLDSLKGPAGERGVDGKSAFEIANEVRVANGQQPYGSEINWLLSLRGSAGFDGRPGADGKSAFQIANEVQEANNLRPFASPEAWLASLKGDDGIAEIIKSMSVSNGQLVIVTKKGDNDTNPKTYYITLPTLTVYVHDGDGNPYVPINKGTLDAAIAHAEDHVNEYFQWLCDTIINPGQENEFTVTKPIWHMRNGRFIDAFGDVLYEGFPEQNTITEDEVEEEQEETNE